MQTKLYCCVYKIIHGGNVEHITLLLEEGSGCFKSTEKEVQRK